ncbi:hypothetical protein AKJ09_01525 [Labilithrix luteola]|uniref:Uncharacterized protein n=1 Tax=Labilithrix luteola TaxID=1391654 RepID=A0A0K1PN93_9BACT|nr:hypothetical protein AKJ09_01525 [Labilithrix luteola]
MAVARSRSSSSRLLCMDSNAPTTTPGEATVVGAEAATIVG